MIYFLYFLLRNRYLSSFLIKGTDDDVISSKACLVYSTFVTSKCTEYTTSQALNPPLASLVYKPKVQVEKKESCGL